MTPEELIEWRERNGFTGKQLAEALGVSNVTVSRWENRAREIPPYLHLALECLERRKGDEQTEGAMKKKKERKVKK